MGFDITKIARLFTITDVLLCRSFFSAVTTLAFFILDQKTSSLAIGVWDDLKLDGR